MKSDAGAKVSALTLSGEINVRAAYVDSAAGNAFSERRAKPRIRQAFSTRVSGVDCENRPFDVHVGLENISSEGLYLRIPRMLRPGDELSLVVQFSNGGPGATAALRAGVVRVDPGSDGLNGIAMAIQRYEFI